MKTWLTAGVGIVVGLATQPVEAKCGTPKHELLWTYPSPGQSSVSTRTPVFGLSAVGRASLTLEGREVEYSKDGFHLLTLEPNQDYSPTLDFYSPSEDNLLVELSFTTGAGEAPPPKGTLKLEGAWATRDASVFSAHCQDVIAAQDCHDAGQNTHLVFELAGKAQKGSIAYLVEARREPDRRGTFANVQWPAECGSPSVYVPAELGASCFVVKAVGENGEVTAAPELCIPSVETLTEYTADAPWTEADGSAAPADAGAEDDNSNDDRAESTGCSIAEPGRRSRPFALGVIALSLAWLRRRRGFLPAIL